MLETDQKRAGLDSNGTIVVKDAQVLKGVSPGQPIRLPCRARPDAEKEE